MPDVWRETYKMYDVWRDFFLWRILWNISDDQIFFFLIYRRVAARDERDVCTVLEVTQSRSNLISLRSLVLSRRSTTWNQNRLTYPSRCLHRLITRPQRVIQSRPCYSAFAYLLEGAEITVWPHYCLTRGIASMIFGRERFTFIWTVSHII